MMSERPSAEAKSAKTEDTKSTYRKRNITLPRVVDGFAEELMALDGYEQFSDFAATLIRDQYSQRGLGKLRELMDLRGAKSVEELFDLLIAESKRHPAHSGTSGSRLNEGTKAGKTEARARQVWDSTKPKPKADKGSASR